MKTLYFYIAKKFFKIFIYAAIAFGFIVLISELFRDINLYMDNKASFLIIVVHLLSKVPWWIIQVLPIATLLALLFSVGDLSKTNQITAIKAAGINLWKVIVLFLIIGLFIGIVDICAREFVVSKTAYVSEKIERKDIRKQEVRVITVFVNFVVSLDDNTRLTAAKLDTKEGYMQNIVLEYYDENFYITKLVLAEKAFWRNNTWALENGVERDFENDLWKEVYFKEYDSGIDLNPQDLAIVNVTYEAMNYKQFKKYINQLRLVGQKALRPRVIFNMRYAAIFCHIIVMMIGIPFVLGLGNKFGKIISFTLALAATFLYWGVQAITQSMGENALLTPFMAAWLPNFIFVIIGVFMLSKIRK